MMPIDPGQRVAAGLPMQLAGRRERAAARAGAATRSEAAARHGAGTVSRAVAQRIAALAPQDPERARKAVRIYLEAELAREFGATLLNDPQFPALVDAVQERMEGEAEMARAVEALARLLLAGQVKAA